MTIDWNDELDIYLRNKDNPDILRLLEIIRERDEWVKALHAYTKDVRWAVESVRVASMASNKDEKAELLTAALKVFDKAAEQAGEDLPDAHF